MYLEALSPLVTMIPFLGAVFYMQRRFLMQLKQEFARMRNDIHEAYTELSRKIDCLGLELKTDVKEIHAGLKGDIAGLSDGLRDDFEGLSTRLEGGINNICTELEGNIDDLRRMTSRQWEKISELDDAYRVQYQGRLRWPEDTGNGSGRRGHGGRSRRRKCRTEAFSYAPPGELATAKKGAGSRHVAVAPQIVFSFSATPRNHWDG